MRWPWKKEAERKSLTAPQITELLDPVDADVAKAVYELAAKQFAAEDTLTGRIDAKATSLFGAVGFCTTLAFTFGGWGLADHVAKLGHARAIVNTFLGVLALGLAAAWFALRALRVRDDLPSVEEAAVFDKVTLEGKVSDFHAHLACHLWRATQMHAEVNTNKANTLRWGQRAFGLFIFGVLALSAAVVLSEPPKSPATPETAAKIH